MGRRKPTYVHHDPDDPSSPLRPHISSTCSSLKEINLSDLIDYDDIDYVVSSDATSVGGGGKRADSYDSPHSKYTCYYLRIVTLESPSTETATMETTHVGHYSRKPEIIPAAMYYSELFQNRRVGSIVKHSVVEALLVLTSFGNKQCLRPPWIARSTVRVG
jgi:hypothetical protein